MCDDPERPIAYVTEDHRPARLDNTRFVPGDILDRRTERDDVIHSDAGYDTGNRIDDVRRIKPAAGPYFDDGDVDGASSKPPITEYRPRFRIAKLWIGTTSRENAGRFFEDPADHLVE
jgi:hypothetical protein